MADEIITDEQSATDVLKIKFLGRDAKISDTGRAMPIEEIRRNVAKNRKNIVIGIADGKRRIGLYRNTYRLDTIEFENGDGYTDEQVREFVRQKIIDGIFDRQITGIGRIHVMIYAKEFLETFAESNWDLSRIHHRVAHYPTR